jgi:hypothetical protein
VTEKGIYPYDYIVNYEVLYETKLPSRKRFYSKLQQEHCSLDDYKKAQKVYETFECENLLQYHNIYLSSDTLLLADIWENFRDVCMKIYQLDPCYYYTAPGLSWDAFLYHTNEEWKEKHQCEFELELLIDIDMFIFFEKAIRGGLCKSE